MADLKSLFISIVGEPNAGKSTLINTILGEKVSIVSPKAQTTRRRLRGILNTGEIQLVFTDTPGFPINDRTHSKLEDVIFSNFWKSFKGSDLILFLIDVTSRNLNLTFDFLKRIGKLQCGVAVAINKVDIAKKENLLKIATLLKECIFIDKVFMISASMNDGVTDLVEYLKERASVSPWFFGECQTTDADVKFRLSEITREKLFLALSNELPYSIYVETEFFAETEKKAKIYQSIVVLKDSQKAIAIGHDGNMIRILRHKILPDMKILLNKKIDLKLFVKVRKKWTEKEGYLRDAGLVDG
ncbi:MAG: GTPase Era [Holosporales bacterium]|jgi:GTP-binding protein Era|nr:GTPase Era [Holosporales bacterium]